MSAKPTNALKISPDAYFNAVGDETVLLHVSQGMYYGIDPVGTRVWEGLAKGQPVESICLQIVEECAAPLDQVRADVDAFIEDLKANELVVAA